jgi:PleD family two-component response regulator
VGEEIAVVLPGIGAEEAKDAAERLRRAIADLRLPHDRNPAGDFHVSASHRCCNGSGPCRREAEAPGRVDHGSRPALYRGKAEGRNRVAATLLLADTSDANVA